ncbi:hypothetical protein ID866_13353 [Astraeus odoratus]|nr:hypothetical protein ID866_13353 [Astraeus odoratus]
MYGPHHIFIMPHSIELNLSRMVHHCRWVECKAAGHMDT